MINLIFIILSFVHADSSGLTQLVPLSCEKLFLKPTMHQSVDRIMTFRRVELSRRNNAIGPQQLGDINIQKWRELDFNQSSVEVFIGLDKQGKMFHLVKTQGRTIGRLLGGQQRFQDFFVTEDGKLFAIDFDGQVHAFKSKNWFNKKNYILTGVGEWALTSAVVMGGLKLLWPEYNTVSVGAGMQSYVPMIDVSLLTSLGLAKFFGILNRYYYANTFPDGFEKLNIKFSTPQELEIELAQLNLSASNMWSFIDYHKSQKLEPKLPEDLTQSIED